jgi:hypothetical protein
MGPNSYFKELMGMRLMVNGREVTNPAARAMAMMVVMAVVAFIMALLLFVALPLLGVAVGVMAGLIGVGAGSLLVGLPLALRNRRIRGSAHRGDATLRQWNEAEETDYTIDDAPPDDSPDDKG